MRGDGDPERMARQSHEPQTGVRDGTLVMATIDAKAEAGESSDVAPAILFRHVSVVVGGVRALDDVSFAVEHGEVELRPRHHRHSRA